MSDATKGADLTNAGRTDIIPGYTLCRPGLEQITAAEQEFGAAFLATVRRSLVDAKPEDKVAEMDAAQRKIIGGEISFGSGGFRSFAFRPTMAPMLAYLCMQRHHAGKVGYAEVLAMFDAARADATDWDYHKGTLELFGWDFDAKKKDDGDVNQNLPIGGGSTASAA